MTRETVREIATLISLFVFCAAILLLAVLTSGCGPTAKECHEMCLPYAVEQLDWVLCRCRKTPPRDGGGESHEWHE